MTRTTLIALATLTLIGLLSGCDRYLFTFNERVVSEPPPLLTEFEVEDAALQTCLEQTIRDKKVRRPQELSQLRCTHAGIGNLEGIEVFSQLETINLADNQLDSIRPLLFLGQLNSANLEGNADLDCSEVSNLREQLEGELRAPEHCRP